MAETTEERKARIASNQKRYYDRIRSENPDLYKIRKKGYRLKREYGISLDIFNSMKDEQNNKCKICKEVFVGQIDVDHCHITGQIRGLLCTHCNKGIGCLRDNITILESAIEYLKETGV